MGLSLFKILGEVFVDDKQAIDALNKVDKQAETTAKSGLSKMVDMAGQVGKGLLIVGGVAIAGATALIALGDKSADTAMSVKKLSTATQMNLKDTQEWSYVFQKTGSNTEALQSSVLKLGQAMAKGDEGAKKINGTFKDLGIATNDSNGHLKKSSDLFGEAMTKLSGMTDVTERNRQAQLLFGGSYTDLLPILNKGAKGIDELKARANELGKVMSDDQVVAGAKYKKAMGDLKEEFGSIATKLGNDMLPYFGKFADWLQANSPKITEFINKVVKVLGDTIAFVSKNGNAFAVVLGIVLAGIMALNAIKTIQEIMVAWNTVVKVATGVQKAWNLAMEMNPIGLVILAVVAFIAIIVLLWTKCDWFRNGIIGIFNGMKDLFFGVVIPYWKALGGIFVGVFESLWNSASRVLGNVKNIFLGIIDFVRNVFMGNWKGAWNDVISIFSNIFAGLGTIWKAPLNAMIGGINGFLGGISKIKIPDWVPGLGGKGFDIPKIPSFAVGSRYIPKDMIAQLHEGEQVVKKADNPYANSGTKGNSNNGVTLQITNFYNNRKEDMQELAEELQFYMKQKELGGSR